MAVTKKKVRKRKSLNSQSNSNTTENVLKTRAPLALALYGPSGVGKTSFCAHFPKPGFIIYQDDGIHDLSTYDQAPEAEFVDKVESFPELLQAIRDAPGRCETLILDNLTDFEQLCFVHHCDMYFGGDWSNKGFYSFNKGPKNAAKTDWPELLYSLQNVVEQGVHVILIAHSRIKTRPNPDGEDYLAWEPQLDAEIWTKTHGWAKATLFYALRVEVNKDSPISKGKASSADYDRYIFTQPSPTYEAKNRYGLPPVIDCSVGAEEAFENFANCFK